MRTFLLTLALVAGCQTPAPEVIPGQMDGGPALLTVDGVDIPSSVFDSILADMPPAQRAEAEAKKGTPEFKEYLETSGILPMMLQVNALYKRAIDEKLYADPEVANAVAFSQRLTLAQEYVKSKAKSEITEEKLQEAYKEREVRYISEEVKASHILVKDEAEAQVILEQLKANGADFAELAKASSIDPSAQQNGGDLGYFQKGMMVPEFEAAAFAANTGDITGPVKTQFGFHIIKVEDKRTNTTSFEEARPELEQELEQAAAQKIVEDIKANMNVVWADDAAPKAEAPAEAPKAEDKPEEKAEAPAGE